MEERRPDIRSILGKHDLLSHLPEEDLDQLTRVATTASYRAGQTIFMKGDAGNAMMVVVSGRVRISRTSIDGKEVVLAVFGPGDVLGEIAMIDGGERTADASALEPTELLVLRRRDFHGYLRTHPEVAIQLLILFCKRLRDTDDQLEDLNFLPLRTRLAKRLLDLSQHYGKETEDGLEITIPLPQQFLASWVGTSREAVNKQLRSWAEAGHIRLRKRTVTIAELEELERVVADDD